MHVKKPATLTLQGHDLHLLSMVEFTGAHIGSTPITMIRVLNLLVSQKVTDHMYLAWDQLLCLINTRQHAEL